MNVNLLEAICRINIAGDSFTSCRVHISILALLSNPSIDCHFRLTPYSRQSWLCEIQLVLSTWMSRQANIITRTIFFFYCCKKVKRSTSNLMNTCNEIYLTFFCISNTVISDCLKSTNNTFI